MKSELEPRYKLLFIPYDIVLESVAFATIGDAVFPKNQRANKLAEIFRLIPDDTEIRHVTVPFARRGFLFTLYHKSFDVVGDFAEIPEIEWSIERKIVETVEPESETFSIRAFVAKQMEEAKRGHWRTK